LFQAFTENITELNLDFEGDELFCQINSKQFRRKVVLDIDRIKKNKCVDENSLVLVHELGHSIVYADLYGVAPTQININAVSMGKGFIAEHTINLNKNYIKNDICVSLAGQVVEELVFGDEVKSTGSGMDIQHATNMASSYIRRYGMDSLSSAISLPDSSCCLNYDIDQTNPTIENMLRDQKNRAHDIILKHTGLLKKLIMWGKDQGKIDIDDFLRICNENDLKITKKEIQDKIIFPYNDSIEKFLKN
jgi:cell division protease FtsH